MGGSSTQWVREHPEKPRLEFPVVQGTWDSEMSQSWPVVPVALELKVWLEVTPGVLCRGCHRSQEHAESTEEER